jgi:hypothetical protein
MPFEKTGALILFFKIDNNYFIYNNKKRSLVLNIKDQTLARFLLSQQVVVCLNSKNNNSIFYWQTGMPNPVFIDG